MTTNEILYGSRTTSYRWEILTHSAGVDRLAGFLDGVVDGSASLSWGLYAAVKGSGNLRVADLDVAQAGFMTIGQVAIQSVRLRPVLVIEGLPEIPFGVFLVSAAPEDWSDTGRVLNMELLDRATALDQDSVDESYVVDATTPILSAVATVVASAGESINVDGSVTDTLHSAMVWPAGTTKLQIVNDLLGALNYNSLWVDGVGNFQATPYLVPAKRSLSYELLNVARELVDGEQSIYSQEWSRDKDLFDVPNKVIAVQSASGDVAALVGEYTNVDQDSPFSYPSRGRWITKVLDSVETPEGSDAVVIAFLEAKAQQSLIASSAVQAAVSVTHLPVPIRVSDVMRFANVSAGIDARHTITSIKLDANPLGLMTTSLQEVLSL
ncbi:hypothetical protein [Cryobacterium sp. Y62]|uniref:hypothetical protein n=1 Tax=Cryobacterium sp. Y62 TaxID=2048284 RepID=UPI0011B08188|nr:hypothetical protein [Cryobacterium sp. Y62]